MATEKIAVTIDRALLRQLETARRRTRQSRSAFVTEALRRFLLAREKEEKVRRYVEVYREMPESDNEVAAIDGLSRESLALVPWDDEE